MKFSFVLLFLLATASYASLLHDLLRRGDLDQLPAILEMGEHCECYRPDAVEKITGQTTIDALAECPDAEKREAMKVLLIKYCEKYNVTISTASATVYANSISDRKFPRLVATKNIEFFEDHEIIELYPIMQEPMRISKSSHAAFVDSVWVVQQHSKTSCGYAVKAMRELDLLGKVSYYSDYAPGLCRNTLIEKLDDVGIAAEAVSIQFDEDNSTKVDHYLAAEIPKRGPAIVNGFNKYRGGHWAIVDEVVLPTDVSTGYGIIREPYHGWRVKVTLEALRTFLGLNSDRFDESDSDNDPEFVVEMIDILWTKKK